ncbi:MAG: hypothetical protein Q4G59_02595 [Planctomycetia bacterium]|nr:hypothetical protein [Planctomycetia bacterium]
MPISKLAALPAKLSAEQLDASYSVPLFERYRIEPEAFRSRFTSGHRNSQAVASAKASEENGEKKKVSFDFRMGWHEDGLVVTTVLSGKSLPPRCDTGNMEYSDGLHFCLDTRDVRDVHRGTRFCHRFFFMPYVSGSRVREPVGFWLPIHRAKALPNPVDIARFTLASNITESGYSLSVVLPGNDLTGYEPDEHKRLGLHFAVSDMELGLFSLQHSTLFPIEEDPSLWATIELVSGIRVCG